MALLLTTASLLIIPGVWCIVSLLLATMSGWRDLARSFATTAPPPGHARLVTHTQLNYITYRSVLRIARAEQSLHLSILGPFRVGHPHLHIPLESIRVEENTGTFGQRVTLYIGGLAELKLRPKDWQSLLRD